MGWIVGISHEQGRMRVVEQTAKRTEVVSLVDAQLTLSVHSQNQTAGKFSELAFADLIPCFDSDAFDRLGIPQAARQVQTIFRFKRGQTTFYIPSQVLIAGLFCQNSIGRESLLNASGFELLGMLVEAPNGAISIEISRGLPRDRLNGSLCFKNALLWSACFLSAKRMVASVFNHALAGRFDLALPSGWASLSFPGLRVGNEVLVQNVLVQWVQPSEKPLAGLEGRIPARISFRERKAGFEVGGRSGKLTTDNELLLGQAGWKLSDDEWLVVSSIATSTMSLPTLKWQGLGRDCREKMEAILRKLSEGISWREVGGTLFGWSNVSVYFGTLQRDGRWSRIKQYLNEVRSAGSEPHQLRRQGETLAQ